MDLINNLALGSSLAFTSVNVLYAFIGGPPGTLIRVLPGIGALATIAMPLPDTATLPPVFALITLAGIHDGAQYGGSTTAMLVNRPSVKKSRKETFAEE